MGDLMRNQIAAVQARTKAAQGRSNVPQLKLHSSMEQSRLYLLRFRCYGYRIWPLFLYVCCFRWAQKKERIHKSRLEKGAEKAAEELQNCKLNYDPNKSETSESKIKREFEAYGPIKQPVTEDETCPACYAHVSPRDKLEVSVCFHRICFTCIRESVSSELARGDTVLCPYPNCKKEVVLEDCRGIVDDDAINLMIHRKKEKAISVLDRVYCPKPSCNFLMSDRDLPLGYSIDPRQKTVARKCVKCGLCFCKNCHVPWHYKKTCNEFKNSESYLKSDAGLFESLVKTQGWIKCPQCTTVIQQNGGCKRITCRHCNHKFCCICGAACGKKKMTCKCCPN